MNTVKRIQRVYDSSPEIEFDESGKFVIMSDVHRGDATWADNFSDNQNIYFQALWNYYMDGYTYIELGDGDELWKNKSIDEIKGMHSHIFWLLSKFYQDKRLYMLYGNHDMVKKDDRYVKKNLRYYLDESRCCLSPLFPGLAVSEGLLLKYKRLPYKILLLHGHQGDTINDSLWQIGRFLVRYIWRPLELFGINDPTRAAKNYNKQLEADDKLIRWAQKSKGMVVAGHTHRPVFPNPGQPLYFNDGSCVHPRCITALEICKGEISLVKWFVDTKSDGVLFINRERLAGPAALEDLFDPEVSETRCNYPSLFQVPLCGDEEFLKNRQ